MYQRKERLKCAQHSDVAHLFPLHPAAYGIEGQTQMPIGSAVFVT